MQQSPTFESLIKLVRPGFLSDPEQLDGDSSTLTRPSQTQRDDVRHQVSFKIRVFWFANFDCTLMLSIYSITPLIYNFTHLNLI